MDTARAVASLFIDSCGRGSFRRTWSSVDCSCGGCGAAAGIWPAIKKLLQQAQAADDLTITGMTPAAVAPSASGSKLRCYHDREQHLPAGGTGADSAQAVAFRSATTDLFTYFQALPVDPPLAPALDLGAIKTTLLARLDPGSHRATSACNHSSRFQPAFPGLPPIHWKRSWPRRNFLQPMYAPLRDLSPDYVLPGVELMPPGHPGNSARKPCIH